MTLLRASVAALLASALCACGPSVLNVTMNPDNNSGQAGFAVITNLGNSFKVEVETVVPDFYANGQQAHIHPGTCGEIGPKKVILQGLVPVPGKTGRVGSTTTVTTMKFEDFKTGDWVINAHDERDFAVYVSCGTIPKP